jgi:hypothetical protein
VRLRKRRRRQSHKSTTQCVAVDQSVAVELANHPTLERHLHGLVMLADGPVKADPGDFGIPYQAIDLVANMRDRGTITDREELAADRFRAWFQIGKLEGLRAADLAKPVVDGGGRDIDFPVRCEKARDEIYEAIRWIGGRDSPGADCLWHVIGLDESLRRWSERQRNNGRNINHMNASGILVEALARLSRMPWRGPSEETT